MLRSRLIELEDTGIVHVLRFSGIDEDEFSWGTVRVGQVDVPVLDHGSIGGIDDGVEELGFDLMEFGVAQGGSPPKSRHRLPPSETASLDQGSWASFLLLSRFG